MDRKRGRRQHGAPEAAARFSKMFLSETSIVSWTMHGWLMQSLIRESFVPREELTVVILGGTV
jgi:hypothetical protein